MIRAKREGDGATPVGRYALRRVLFRPDRLDQPRTGLPIAAITPDDGWCDDARSPDYNRPVILPNTYGHEVLWRDDSLYDIIVVLGHNDDPPRPGLGSAIFLHVARPGYLPTEGCIALAREDLLAYLSNAVPGSHLTTVP